MLVAFIRNHFPTRYEDVGVNDGGGGGADDGWFDERGVASRPRPRPRRGRVGGERGVRSSRRILLAQAEDLNLPPNFLDELIDELGSTAAVAEMTGRRARVVRVAAPRGKGDSDDSGDDVPTRRSARRERRFVSNLAPSFAPPRVARGWIHRERRRRGRRQSSRKGGV